MAELAERIGRNEDAKEFAQWAEAMTQRINEHAWDGEWYIYAINSQGEPIGSNKCEEGKMHLNVNTWALFTGIAAAAGRAEQVWKSIEKLATPTGHRLLWPAYTDISRECVGRIADQMCGMFENGSIYTHAEAFYLFALAHSGNADEFISHLYKTLPSNVVPDIVTGPPHQQSNFFVGPDHEAFGANLFSNSTGSISWYRNTIEKIIGIIPDYDCLRIEPNVPASWDEFKVKRTWRGTELNFNFKRTGEFAIKLNGQLIEDDKLSALDLAGEKKCNVEIAF